MCQPAEQLRANDRARDRLPGLFGVAPLTQDLLARGKVRRSRSGTTSCKRWTAPCLMGSLRAQVPIRAQPA